MPWKANAADPEQLERDYRECCGYFNVWGGAIGMLAGLFIAIHAIFGTSLAKTLSLRLALLQKGIARETSFVLTGFL